jgi:hypothetical protein
MFVERLSDCAGSPVVVRRLDSVRRLPRVGITRGESLSTLSLYSAIRLDVNGSFIDTYSCSQLDARASRVKIWSGGCRLFILRLCLFDDLWLGAHLSAGLWDRLLG